MLAFQEKNVVSFFKNRAYEVSVLIALSRSRMCASVCVSGADAGPSLIKADIPDPLWQYSIRNRIIADIRGGSNTKLEVFEAITPHPPYG